jgi:L-lactate dehydrogenase (cytochrome)
MMPIALGPVGATGMYARCGGVQAARAASAAAIPYALPTVSVCSIEEVARGADGQLRSQLCVLKDHGYTRNNPERAGPGKKTLTALPLAISPRNQRLLPSSRRAR